MISDPRESLQVTNLALSGIIMRILQKDWVICLFKLLQRSWTEFLKIAWRIKKKYGPINVTNLHQHTYRKPLSSTYKTQTLFKKSDTCLMSRILSLSASQSCVSHNKPIPIYEISKKFFVNILYRGYELK